MVARTPDGERTLQGLHLLVATGRTPNTEELHLAAAGVETGPGGYIRVNERLETNVPGIYALGDVKGDPAFTHISYDDFRIIRANLLEGGHRTTEDHPLLRGLGLLPRPERTAAGYRQYGPVPI